MLGFIVCVCVGARPHPVRVSVQRPDHDDEERLLQQSDHSADHGLQARQGAKVVGRVSVRDTRPPIFTLPINDAAVNCKVDQVVFSVNDGGELAALTQQHRGLRSTSG